MEDDFFEGLEDLFSARDKFESLFIANKDVETNVLMETNHHNVSEVLEVLSDDEVEELFTVAERQKFESVFTANKVGVETNVSRETDLDKNKASELLKELFSDDETDEKMVDPRLEKDLAELMESFKKSIQESPEISKEMLSQQDDEALTVAAAALLDLEKNPVVHDKGNVVVVLDDEEEGVHHDDNSLRGEKAVADVDVGVHGTVPGGFMPSGDYPPWRNRSVGSGNVAFSHPISGYFALNNNRYSEYLTWNYARNANLISGRFTDQSHISSGPWSNLTTPAWVLGSSAPMLVQPLLSSTWPSFSSDSGSPPIRQVDLKSMKNPSWGKKPLHDHEGHFGQPSSSSPTPPTSHSLGKGELSSESRLPPRQKRGRKGSTDKSEPPPRKRGRNAPLPAGWVVVARVRQTGKSKGQIDKYYVNEAKNLTCRSLVEVYRLEGLNPDGSSPLTS